MIPVYSPSTIRSLDKYAVEQLGISSLVLMENAAMNIVAEMKSQGILANERFGIVCGRGNNGGDGYALARQLLIDGKSVNVISLYPVEQLSPDAKANYAILTRLPATQKKLSLHKYNRTKFQAILNDCDVIIDAILGSGAKGELDSFLSEVIKSMNDIKRYKIAIDIPTGVDAATGYCTVAFEADMTIMLGGVKTGVCINSGLKFAGTIINSNIGIPFEPDEHEPVLFKAEAFMLEEMDVYFLLPNRARDLNKYSAGKVLTIGGSRQYLGAGLLTATSAFYAGAGASVLAIPLSIAGWVHPEAEPNLVIDKYNDNSTGSLARQNIDEMESRIDWADVVVIGPGVSTDASAREAVTYFINRFPDKPIIVDADGLAGFKAADLRANDHLIITPHLGEFAKLSGKSTDELRKNLLSHVRGFSAKHNCYIALKDFSSFIVTPQGETLINATGNTGLAKFGTGDVLSGIIAGFYAQTKDPLPALILGMYLHGLSADLLAEEFTEFGYSAQQIMHELPKAIKLILDMFNPEKKTDDTNAE